MGDREDQALREFSPLIRGRFKVRPLSGRP